MNCSKEALLDELTDFSNQKPAEIPSILDEYLSHIAKTGDTLFPWHKLKPLVCRKLELVMNEFHKISPTDDLPALPNVEVFKYEDMKTKVLEAVNSFNSAPFTIQRLCELVVDPRKHYKRTDKFMRGIEKNVLVVSTIEPRSLTPLQQSNTSAVPMVNGIPGAEDGGINGHFADTTEDSLGHLDAENGHCEDEGICADDPGTNVEVPSSAADATSLGEAPQPVSEEVIEGQQEVEPSESTERLEAEPSKSEAKPEAEPSTVTECAEVEKEEAQQPTEEAAPSEAPAENIEPPPPSVEDESPKQAEAHVEESTLEESSCDKDDSEAVITATANESDLGPTSGSAEVEALPDATTKVAEPSQSALDLSEADAMPVDASDLKPADIPPGGDGPLETDFNGCDSSISDMPGGDEELKEPPLKKFHPEPEASTEALGADQQEQPSSTSAPMDDSPEEEPMDSSKADVPTSADDPTEAMDTTADSSVEKDSPPSGEQQTTIPDESPMEEN